MKVAIDLSSTQSGHKYRGIGSYTSRLWSSLQKLTAKNSHIKLIKFRQKNSSAVEHIDLYHFPSFSPFFFSFPIQLIKQSVITIHDLIPLQFPKHYPAGIKGTIRWQIQKAFIRYAKHIITDSKASKKVIQQMLKIPPHKISVVYLAPDPSSRIIADQYILQSIRDKYHLPTKFVLYVGDINWNKQIMLLAKLCVKLRYPLIVVGKQATNFKIDIMHPWNESLAKFQAYAKENSILIKTLGYVAQEDLVAIYNLATVYVMPSIAEGFGLPILDAMQSGCPVICGNISSMQEITQDSAFHFDPDNSQSLKKALRLVFNDSKLRLELHHKGLAHVKQFTWEKTAQQTLDIYQQSLS